MRKKVLEFFQKIIRENFFTSTSEKYLRKRISELFDSRWYLAIYQDVRIQGIDPLKHFLEHGAAELRNPSPFFETAWYVNQYSDCDPSKINPLAHCILKMQSGIEIDTASEKWRKWSADVYLLIESELFDPDWYLKTYRDVALAQIDPFFHFINFGAAEHRDPSALFDTEEYVDLYPDALSQSSPPVFHYLRNRHVTKFSIDQPSKYSRWCQYYDDLSESDINIIRQDIRQTELPRVAILIPNGFDRNRTQQYSEIFFNQLHTNWELLPNEIHKEKAEMGFGSIIKTLETTEYVLVVEEAVSLRPHCIYMLVKAGIQSGAELIYSDSDLLLDGARVNPQFKPDYSPELQLNTNYIGPVFLTKSSTIIKALAMISKDSLELSCLNLKQLILKQCSIRNTTRVPNILYHTFNLDYQTSNMKLISCSSFLPTVSIIIPTRNSRELLQACIESILSLSTYKNALLEIIVVDNGSTDRTTIEYLSSIASQDLVKIISDTGPFNFSRINNIASKQAHGDVLIFLNNDTVVLDPDWISKITYYLGQEDVACVGATLLYPDQSIQHAGIVLGVQGVAAHVGIGMSANERKDLFNTNRERSAVTGACLAIRADVFHRLGGFDEILAVAFNDVDLCLAALTAGYRNICIADPLLLHYESKSRGFDDTIEKIARFRREASYARSKHRNLYRDDPYYNPNLCLQRIEKIAFPPRDSKPWRYLKGKEVRKVLFLSITHARGHGVPVVIAEQIKAFHAAGYKIYIGGPRADIEIEYTAGKRVFLPDARSAANWAVKEGIDCVIVHTPPFFSIVRWLGKRPAVIFFDHGEPPPELFSDLDKRRSVQEEKKFCAEMATKIIGISKSVRNESSIKRMKVIRNGNSHLTTWLPTLNKRRKFIRNKFGWENKIVVLNVCRFEKETRFYKGIDTYLSFIDELKYSNPFLYKKTVFILCGKATVDDVEDLSETSLLLFGNVSDAEMIDLYCAADIYMNHSKWEGYNLGIGQALAVGLPVISSDIPAHREFNIFNSNFLMEMIDYFSKIASDLPMSSSKRTRNTRIYSWREPTVMMVKECEAAIDEVAWS